MNIFVGNLSFKAGEEDLKNLFKSFGAVDSVRIVMEKKGKKSRGFGFVQMPDEQQALAAISALNGNEFMGRPLNVSPARSKPEVERDKGEAKERHLKADTKGRKDPWYKPAFEKKAGRYKTGRRSRSFMKRCATTGIAQEASPEPKSGENPMRWRKKQDQPKPWKKRAGGKPNPLRRNRRHSRPRQSLVESRRKPGGYNR